MIDFGDITICSSRASTALAVMEELTTQGILAVSWPVSVRTADKGKPHKSSPPHPP